MITWIVYCSKMFLTKSAFSVHFGRKPFIAITIPNLSEPTRYFINDHEIDIMCMYSYHQCSQKS